MGEYYIFHWLVADTAESASAVFLTVVMLASTVAALPAGVLAGPTYLGSSEDQLMADAVALWWAWLILSASAGVVMGSSFVIGAACLAALALSTSFTPALFVVSRPQFCPTLAGP